MYEMKFVSATLFCVLLSGDSNAQQTCVAPDNPAVQARPNRAERGDTVSITIPALPADTRSPDGRLVEKTADVSIGPLKLDPFPIVDRSLTLTVPQELSWDAHTIRLTIP